MVSEAVSEFFDSSLTRAYIYGIICLFGVATNGYSAACLLTLQSFRNPFGYTQGFHNLTNALTLFFLMLWSIFFIIVGPNKSEDFSYVNKIFGQLSLVAYECSVLVCLCVALTRFTAVKYPLKYRSNAIVVYTKAMIGITIVLGLGYGLVFIIFDCSFTADVDDLIYQFSDTTCGNIVRVYIDWGFNIAMHIICAFIDCLTLASIRRLKNTKITVYRQRKSQLQQETKYYMQTVVILVIKLFVQFSFHVASHLTTTSFELFISTTVIWTFSMGLEGLVIVLLNPEIRIRISKKCSPMPTNATSTT